MNGQIVARNLPLARGSYQGWLAVSYLPVNPPPGAMPTVVVSTAVQFTIN